MFTKAKKDEGGMPDVPVPPATAAAKANGKPQARRADSGVPSLISADVIVRGSIESLGEVQFDGEIEGDIKARGLVIGEGARVCGEVVAEKVRVCGTVEGAIRATRVELAAGALVRGEVTHAALAIEAGARFEGNVSHSDDPIGAASLPAPRPRTVPSEAASGAHGTNVKKAEKLPA